MKKPKIDTRGTIAAQQAIAQAQAQANNLKKNFETDLTNENLSNVVAAGSADAIPDDIGTARKRKPVGGLASQLGINV